MHANIELKSLLFYYQFNFLCLARIAIYRLILRVLCSLKLNDDDNTKQSENLNTLLIIIEKAFVGFSTSTLIS